MLLCRGYKIQFHIVNEESPNGIPVLHANELVPFGEYAPSDPSHASKASQPISFQLSFQNDSIPAYVLTDDSVLFATALKKNVKYSVVTIAYSKSKEQSVSDFILFQHDIVCLNYMIVCFRMRTLPIFCIV